MGLDVVTGGGLPTGRTTLLAGGAGCGKTLFAMTFLVEGALAFGQPGVFVTFEENADELAQNVASLGYDLDALEAKRKLLIEQIRIDTAALAEAGDYDLEGLFIRLGHAIDSIGAKRVVLDTVEVLMGALNNAALVRAELRRLFGWLKSKGVTAILTAERGEGRLTRSGLEEYVSDCVILLDQRVEREIATRRLRVVKYRGSAHGTNEYPFIIDEEGINVFPITSLQLSHKVTDARMPSGIDQLDLMLAGEGFYRGTSVLISGPAGSGKSCFSATITQAACDRGERCVYFAFEESPTQMVRNMRSLGLELDRHCQSGLLRFHAARPTLQGLDTHLAVMEREITRHDPQVVIVDPVSALVNIGTDTQVENMLLRLVDLLKSRGITAVFTRLDRQGQVSSAVDASLVSALIDTWIVLSDTVDGGEANRTLFVKKSRGMAHSNQVREFMITSQGIRLLEPYLGPKGAVMGSARVAQEARDAAAAVVRRDEIERRRRELERKRTDLDHQIAALRRQFETDEDALKNIIAEDEERDRQLESDRQQMGVSRRSAPSTAADPDAR